MKLPDGTIPPRQYEALKALWEIGPPGATTLQVWEHISQKRSVVRTTVLNVLDTLHKRGWVSRKQIDGEWHYWPRPSRQEIEAQIARDFTEKFFDGSASELVVSLIGDSKMSAQEIDRLKNVLDEARKAKARKRSKRR